MHAHTRMPYAICHMSVHMSAHLLCDYIIFSYAFPLHLMANYIYAVLKYIYIYIWQSHDSFGILYSRWAWLTALLAWYALTCLLYFIFPLFSSSYMTHNLYISISQLFGKCTQYSVRYVCYFWLLFSAVKRWNACALLHVALLLLLYIEICMSVRVYKPNKCTIRALKVA